MSAWEIIKKSFRDFYKHLFLLGAVSLIWFFLVGPMVYVTLGGIALRNPVPIILGLVFIGPLTLGAFYLTNKLIKFEEMGIRDYFRGFAKFFVRGMLGYWLTLFIFSVLIVDFLFFAGFGSVAIRLFSGIWIYLIIFYAMSQMYFWSLLIESQEKIFSVLKQSLLMTLGNMFYSIVIFIVFCLLVLVGVVTAGVGLAVTFIGFMGILANNATYNLLVKYELRKELTSPYSME